MAFTSWAALETALLDALYTYVSGGSPITKKYTLPNGTSHEIRSFEELKTLLEYVRVRKSAETGGSTSSRVSYGRHRRFT